MIRTKYWLSVLAISVILLTGSLANTPVALADEDDDDDDDENDENDKRQKKNQVWTGDGPPPDRLGKIGDGYIDNSSENCDFYINTAQMTWTFVKELCGASSTGPTGAEKPISIGGALPSTITTQPCSNSAAGSFTSLDGPAVLHSDGTVKVQDTTGSFVTLNSAFGSLPAGVWHDIEVAEHIVTSFPENCFGGPHSAFINETLIACAVADTGDVFCVNAFVSNGNLMTGIGHLKAMLYN